MKVMLFVLISLFINPIAGFATWQAKVVDVYDGDTLILSDDGRATIIQLFGVDSPEKEQPFGLRATDYLRNKVSGKDISIVTVDTKRYPRCMVYIEGKCINEELLEAGYAWHDKRYSSDEKWENLEKKAVAQKKGLWSQAVPVPPWEFRGGENQQDTERRFYTIKLGGKHETGRVPLSLPSARKRTKKKK